MSRCILSSFLGIAEDRILLLFRGGPVFCRATVVFDFPQRVPESFANKKQPATESRAFQLASPDSEHDSSCGTDEHCDNRKVATLVQESLHAKSNDGGRCQQAVSMTRACCFVTFSSDSSTPA